MKNCILFMLWCWSGPENRTRVINESLAENITNIIMTTMQSSVNVVTIKQSILIVNGTKGIIECPEGLKISQNINNYNQIKSTFASEQRQNFVKRLENLIDSQVSQVNKEVIGFLSKEPSASNIVNIANRIKSVISTTITDTTLQNILNKTQAYQNVEVYNEGIIRGTNCIIDQNIFLKLFAYSVLNAISEAALKDDVVNKAVNTIQQELDTKSEGITGMFSWIAIIVGALAVLAIIGVIIYFFVIRKKKK